MNSDNPPVQKPKWYFRTYTLVIIILSFPLTPLALPLIWLNKGYTRKRKITWTIITVISTYLFFVLTKVTYELMIRTYQQLLQQIDKPL